MSNSRAQDVVQTTHSQNSIYSCPIEEEAMPQVQATVPWDWEHRRRVDALDFPEDEYETRMSRLRVAMQDAGLTHLIAYSNFADPGSVRWLSGYSPSLGEALVVVSLDGEPTLVSNWVLHNEPMHSGIYHSWIRDTRVCAMGSADIAEEAVAALGSAVEARRIGLAGSRIIPERIMAQLLERSGVDHFADGDTPLGKVRSIKSPREIDAMRQAARITGAGLAAALAACVPGVSEQTVMGVAHGTMFLAGAEQLAFETAVASGPLRAGLKHCFPTQRVMQSGDMVFLDMGAAYHGYNADVSRCTIVGSPTPEARRLMIAAEELFAGMLELGGPGKAVADWNQDGLRLARELGYDAFYQAAGLGHGLGCMVFERPSLSDGPNPEVLEPGMVFAFEPMFVVNGLGTGVVEETVLVTEHGLEPLSGLPTRTFSL
jgi:Xaa-Pro dipeptidase